MKIYLASRYSRREELNRRWHWLEYAGFEVTSRWLLGDHQVSDSGLSEEAAPEERERFAQEDWDDLAAADICISFTEEPRSGHSRGGRRVEFGAALAMGKRCIVIGPRENVFHCLPSVEVYPLWDLALTRLWFMSPARGEIGDERSDDEIMATSEALICSPEVREFFRPKR